jgi:hypothetical protein
MITAPVQCDIDGIPKGSHCASVPPMGRLDESAMPNSRKEIGRHRVEGANGSEQLPIGESMQGVCLQEDLYAFVEELAIQ